MLMMMMMTTTTAAAADDDDDDGEEDDTINVARRKISDLQVFYVVLLLSILVYWKLC